MRRQARKQHAQRANINLRLSFPVLSVQPVFVVMLERTFGVKRNHAGKRCMRARKTSICRCHFAHGCLAELRRSRCARANIGVMIFPGCVFLSMVYASELGEPGESLRNLNGRYPRGARLLFRAANAKGDPGRRSLIVKCKIDIVSHGS